ncbi:MAG: CHRD domain-containing protein [Bauldia sp.]
MRTPLVLSLLVAGSVFAVAPAFAEVVTYRADLKGSAEVPPNNSAGSGTVEATYDTATKVLTYTATYTGLSGPATAAHFHGPAEPTQAVGVALPVPPAVGFASPIKATSTLTDAQAADFQAGKWYFNIHTAANPGGEIRGQMSKR